MAYELRLGGFQDDDIKLAPLGVFALTSVVGAKLGGFAFGALSFYIIVDAIGLLLGTVVLCALAIVVGRLPFRSFFGGASPAQLTALSTSSSLASLPAMIEGARDQWGLREDVIGFVLPLAVSTFKPGSAIAWPIITLFVATLYGIHLSPAQIILIAAYVVLMNPTVPGIPNGGFIVIPHYSPPSACHLRRWRSLLRSHQSRIALILW